MDLDRAHELVAHDLHGRFEQLLEAALQHRRWWVEQWPGGIEHVPGLLAQDVQEAIHADHDPLWPRCTESTCPAVLLHALFVEPDLGPDPFWTCHRTGLPVAPVGSLERATG